MPWLIIFILSWILLLVFIDTKRIRFSIWGGLIAMVVAYTVDMAGQSMDLYHFRRVMLPFAGSSLLYLAGPVFTMGILFFQFLHRDRVIQAANILAFSLTYLSIEYLLVNAGAGEYIHWHYLASLGVNILAFTAFSYIGEGIINKLENEERSRV